MQSNKSIVLTKINKSYTRTEKKNLFLYKCQNVKIKRKILLIFGEYLKYFIVFTLFVIGTKLMGE